MKILKRSHASSTTTIAALFIVGLLIGAAVVYAVTSTSAKTTTITTSGGVSTTTVSGSGQPALGTVTIGVLSDLSDGLSSEGLRVQAYAQQAVKDINAWVQNTTWAGKVTFKVDVVDYAGSPTTGDQDLKSLAASGVTVAVGPLSSGVASAMLADANSLHVVLISPSSTSPAIAIPNDYLFRTAPDDFYQGQADAAMFAAQNVKGLIIVYRDDTYGSGLENYTAADFSSHGGSGVTVDAIPYSATATSFTNILPTINSDYQALVAKYGANSVAIDAISFEELGYLLTEAQSSYPALLQTPQPWYATDGLQGDTAMTNSTYGTVTQDVRMTATVFGYTNSSKSLSVCNDFSSQPNLSCDSYALGGYDDVWLGALSILDCGANNGVCVQKVLPSVANDYFGATGWTQLNAAGDRQGGDYQIWTVMSPKAGENWYLSGSWSAISGTVTWLPGMQPST
jgi:branched-chain amino acid transport system substrate-binding protein